MTRRTLVPIGVAGFLVCALAGLLFHRGEHRAPVQIHPPTDTTGISAADPITPKSSTGEVDNLTEKKQTLEGEVRYARAKLDAAQKQLAMRTSAGDVEAANREAKDWQARLDTTRAQLAQVEMELDRATQRQHDASVNSPVVPGQVLDVLVNEDPSFNGRYQVRRGGYIIMPQVGRVAVAGRTIPEAGAAVQRALQSSQLTRASVQIERVASSDIESGPTIYFSGEFVRPGNWQFPNAGAPTMSNLFRYFGITDNADLTRVKVMRVNEKQAIVKEIDVLKLMNGDQQTPDLTLEDGDVVVIPAVPSPVPEPPTPHPAQLGPEGKVGPESTVDA